MESACLGGIHTQRRRDARSVCPLHVRMLRPTMRLRPIAGWSLLCLLAMSAVRRTTSDYVDAAERPAAQRAGRRRRGSPTATATHPGATPGLAASRCSQRRLRDRRPGGRAWREPTRTGPRRSQPMPAQPPADAELALRIKLEYEQECYKQAEQPRACPAADVCRPGRPRPSRPPAAAASATR